MRAALPDNEEARLLALAAYKALDTNEDPVYNDFIQIASFIAEAPIALVTFIDKDTQHFKMKVGIEATENSRDLSFCAHAILTPDKTLVVEDATLDPRFADNPVVVGDMKVRFYCGVPLITDDNFALGTMCVVDRKPRQLSADQIEALEALQRRIMNRLEVHKAFKDLEASVKRNHTIGHTTGINGVVQKLGNLLLKKAKK